MGRLSSLTDGECPLGQCDGTGFYLFDVRFGHPAFGQLQTCDCKRHAHEAKRQALAAQFLAQFDAEMGGDLAHCTLANYQLDRAEDDEARESMEEALAACVAYAKAPAGWLYLQGSTGVGKSHLAAATARAITRRFGTASRYASEPALIKFLRAGFKKGAEQDADERMTMLQECDLLVLDDLGTAYRGNDKSWVDAQIFDLLFQRHKHSRLTIFTSNAHPDSLEPRIGSRIKGRCEPRLIINSDQREEGL